MQNGDSKIYEFNGFRLEAAQRRLLYQGQSVPLKPKVLDLLLLLVQRRGQLVVKEELMREIWPDAIVEENNITVSMSVLRKALGVDQDKRQFIETVPRRGYRFLAEVTEISDTPTASEVERFAAPSMVLKDEPIDSLAVLPMQGPGNDPNVEYLSEGITESIINTLSRIRQLRVLACRRSARVGAGQRVAR